MVAGLAALRLLDDDTVAYVNRLGDRLARGVREVAKQRGVALQVTGVGSLRHLHLAAEPPTTMAGSRASQREVMALLALRLITEGVLAARNGLFALSTVTTEAEIDVVVEQIARALEWLRPAIAEQAPELLRA